MSTSSPPHPAVVAATLRYRDPVLRSTVAVVSAASAGVHAALVPDHLVESTRLGAAFLVSVALLAGVAVTVRQPARDSRGAPVAALVLLGVACAYLLSRSTGIPVLAPEPEATDPLGAMTTVGELVGAAAALLLHLHRREPM